MSSTFQKQRGVMRVVIKKFIFHYDIDGDLSHFPRVGIVSSGLHMTDGSR